MKVTQMPRNAVADTMSPQEFPTTHQQGLNIKTEESFYTLVETYSGWAYNVSFRMLRNAADAEDAVQEAFLSAYRAFPGFKGQSKTSTWLYRIVVNACLLKIRKDRIRAKYVTQMGYDDPIAHDWSVNPEKAAMNGELHDVLEAGLSFLGPEFRAAVVLKDVQGLSNEEAAEALGVRVPAFKSRLHRGRVNLRKYLEGYLTKPATVRFGEPGVNEKSRLER